MTIYTGTSGNDELLGSADSDELYGLAGDDSLFGNDGEDTLSGAAGNDLLDGGSGADSMKGGSGNDDYFVDDSADVVSEAAAEGIDTVVAFANYTLGANIEILELRGAGAIAGTGNALNNLVSADEGDNHLRGLAGADTLDGGAGNDTLEGGAGNDTYFADSAQDVVIESGAVDLGGWDTVIATVSWVLGSYQEGLYLGGKADITATGNSLDNRISGNAGNNLIDGDLGADTMTGGGGNDRYVVDAYGDQVVEEANRGVDTIVAATTFALGHNLENLVLSGSRDISGEGNELANRLTGQSGRNTLRGNAGNDTLFGGADADVLHGGQGFDVLRGGAGPDVFQLDSATNSNDGAIIKDFNPGIDRISLPRIFFQELPVGDLAPAAYYESAGANAAHDADDRIVYDTSSGALYYDADGIGGTAAVLIAQLSGVEAPALNSSDFLVQLTTRAQEASGTIDTVIAQVDYTLRVGGANLTLFGTAKIGGGNDVENVIQGNAQNNRLSGFGEGDLLVGSGGADTLLGGAGDDILEGDWGSDTFFIDYPGGIDLITDFVSGVDTLKLNDRVFTYFDSSLSTTIRPEQFFAGPNATGAPNLTVRFIYDTTSGTLFYDADGFDPDGSNPNPGDAPAIPFAVLGLGDHPLLASSDLRLGSTATDAFDEVRSSESLVLPSFEVTNLIDVHLEGTRNLKATGNESDNLLSGNAGDNLLTGLSGDDTLVGFQGNDTLSGGDGADTYYVDDAGDVLIEPDPGAQSASGDAHPGKPGSKGTSGAIDTARSTVDRVLESGVENLTLLGSASLRGDGNELDNLMLGNTGHNALSGFASNDILVGDLGDDTLDGGTGIDILTGGAGNDTFVVDTAGDVTGELDGEGIDLVQASLKWTLGLTLENLELLGTGAIDGIGNDNANYLSGNAAANRLTGGLGADTLVGGAGNDTLSGGIDADVLSGGAGDDRLSGGGGPDVFRFDSEPGPTPNVDRVVDFKPAYDTLQLDIGIFDDLGVLPGASLFAGQFRKGIGLTAAVDDDDRILYNLTTGTLYYDPDGTGSAIAVPFAVLGTTTHPSIGASVFVIVG